MPQRRSLPADPPDVGLTAAAFPAFTTHTYHRLRTKGIGTNMSDSALMDAPTVAAYQTPPTEVSRASGKAKSSARDHEAELMEKIRECASQFTEGARVI